MYDKQFEEAKGNIPWLNNYNNNTPLKNMVVLGNIKKYNNNNDLRAMAQFMASVLSSKNKPDVLLYQVKDILRKNKIIKKGDYVGYPHNNKYKYIKIERRYI
jgi:hypothetical protein